MLGVENGVIAVPKAVETVWLSDSLKFVLVDHSGKAEAIHHCGTLVTEKFRSFGEHELAWYLCCK